MRVRKKQWYNRYRNTIAVDELKTSLFEEIVSFSVNVSPQDADMWAFYHRSVECYEYMDILMN